MWWNARDLIALSAALLVASVGSVAQTTRPTHERVLPQLRADRAALPVPPGSLTDGEAIASLVSFATVRQIDHPRLRSMAWAVPGGCAAVQRFFKRHWADFRAVADGSRGLAFAFFRWHGQRLIPLHVASAREGEAVADLSMSLFDPPEPEASWCSLGVFNRRFLAAGQ